MKVILLLSLMILIVGCSQSSDDPVNQQDGRKQSTLLDAQMDALDSAGDVEDSLELMKKAREEEMRKQGT